MPRLKHRLLLELPPELLARLGRDDTQVSAISLACIAHMHLATSSSPAYSSPISATQSAPLHPFHRVRHPFSAYRGTHIEHHLPEDVAVADDSHVRLFTHRRVRFPTLTSFTHLPLASSASSPSQTSSRSARNAMWVSNRRTRARASRECGGQQRDGWMAAEGNVGMRSDQQTQRHRGIPALRTRASATVAFIELLHPLPSTTAPSTPTHSRTKTAGTEPTSRRTLVILLRHLWCPLCA
ncbi:hypothetical protein B0H16DRAFT_715010 [Mycena metata]|uniref:Uncharacterized protein n=1 Tax=Mycena metata TaxID=1033252 RepID=A0AAD7J2G3_9AGAR|nr:hypothetical protein B0H16DRAFT_715010 [Mycena metata]